MCAQKFSIYFEVLEFGLTLTHLKLFGGRKILYYFLVRSNHTHVSRRQPSRSLTAHSWQK